MNIIYEDKHVLIVEKAAGVATQTSNITQTDMVDEVKKYLTSKYKKKKPYVALINRLDQPVRGIVIFALDEKSATDLNKQITEGKINKCYYAVVEGILENKDYILLEDYIYKEGKQNKAIVDKNNKQAKKAQLEYRVLDKDIDNNLSLIDIRLITGRFHQIRCQLSNINHPIKDDKKYGANEGMNRINDKSIALCAYKIGFCHPESREYLEFNLDLLSGDFLDKYR